MSLVVRLPLPDRGLSPNARLHHMAKHRLTLLAKRDGWLATREAAGTTRPEDIELPRRIPIAITWRLPDNRQRDDDNLIASLKAYRDGIAAALGVDDSRFDIVRLTRTVDRANPGVVIEVSV